MQQGSFLEDAENGLHLYQVPDHANRRELGSRSAEQQHHLQHQLQQALSVPYEEQPPHTDQHPSALRRTYSLSHSTAKAPPLQAPVAAKVKQFVRHRRSSSADRGNLSRASSLAQWAKAAATQYRQRGRQVKLLLPEKGMHPSPSQ